MFFGTFTGLTALISWVVSLAVFRTGELQMSKRFGFLAAVIVVSLGASEALAQSGNAQNQQRQIQNQQRQIQNQQRQIQNQQRQIQNRIRQQQNQNRQQQNRNNNNNSNNKQTPTEAVLENLRAAQGDIERKNTSDATRQLQGAENILTDLAKNQNGNKADEVNEALKNVRSAQASIKASKLSDADNAIAQAMKDLRGNNNQKNRNNK
jgi:hypothetical protein